MKPRSKNGNYMPLPTYLDSSLLICSYVPPHPPPPQALPFLPFTLRTSSRPGRARHSIIVS